MHSHSAGTQTTQASPVNESMPHAHGTAGASMPMMQSKTGNDAIQWDDPTNSDKVNTAQNVLWKIVDQSTGKINMDINDWVFTKGQLVKIRFTNDANAMHIMQHPIHFHGQKFVVLSHNGVLNQNMVWKDTALVPPGEYMDILVEMSNPGEWMAHCHISEHIHAGMMFPFRVQEADGTATGDAYRRTVASKPTAQSQKSTSPSHMDMSAMNHANMNMGQTSGAGTVQPLSYSYSDIVADSIYTVSADTQFVEVGKDSYIALTFSDAQGVGMTLDEKIDRAVTVTFVNSDNTVRFVTYPGNTIFPTSATVPTTNIPGTPGFDESIPHSHSSSFFNIPTVYAHGGIVDGHVVASGGRTYTVPATFPSSGKYKAFVAFTLAGESVPRIATFDVEVGVRAFSVNNYGWSPTVRWWILFLVSISIMVPLIIGVRSYLKPKNI